MAPRRTNQAATDQPTNEWEELRRTLLAMQENIQATIHNSMRELAESVYLLQRDRRRQPSEDGSTEADGTPLAEEEVQHRGNRFDRTNMFPRLQNLRQGSRSVDDYAEEFSLLLSQEILDIEVQLASRFIGGLRPQLREAMSQFYPLTVAEDHRRAVAVVPEDASSQVDENEKDKDVVEEELSPVPITTTTTSTVELEIILNDGESGIQVWILFRSDQTVRDIRDRIAWFRPEDKKDYYLKSDTGVEYRDLDTTVHRITSGSFGSKILHQLYST